MFIFVFFQILDDSVTFQQYTDNDVTTSTKSTSTTNDDVNDRPRILIGIFSTDFADGKEFRTRHRTLFHEWNDTRICSLYDYEQEQQEQLFLNNISRVSSKCELIYTFVVGANPKGLPQLLNDDHRSWTVPRPIKNANNDDINTSNDITLLNIRENMNEGKSQSWIAYCSQHLFKLYHFDYIAKWDADSILLLPEFFHFVHTNLPTTPYNSMVYIGTPFDKVYWEQNEQTDEEHVRVESFFENYYNRVHVYITGELYIIANDLAQYIIIETMLHHCIYCEGVEDHDISTIAYHGSPKSKPIKFVLIGKHQQFWIHPIKTKDEWNSIWRREKLRISKHQQQNHSL
jgi:Galactosyltransferase